MELRTSLINARNRLFALFRLTAFPIDLLATTAILVTESEFFAITNTSNG